MPMECLYTTSMQNHSMVSICCYEPYRYTNKLRLAQDDEMERLSRKIGGWSDAQIAKMQAKDTYREHDAKTKETYF